MSKPRNSKKSTAAQAPKQEQPKQEQRKSGSAPTHVLYHIAENPRGGKPIWTPIAVGWVVNGGISIRARAGAFLQAGESYQLRERTEKKDGDQKPQQPAPAGDGFEDSDIPF